MKKLLCILLFAVLVFSVLPGCNSETKSLDDVAEVWTEGAQTKILRNQRYEGKTEDSIDVEMSKNEYQGAQIQVYAKEDIPRYNLTVSDLYSDLGVIPAADIEISVFKYMEIEKKSNELREFYIGAEIPDAMIPIDAIRKYKEDKIHKGYNQGFYLDFHTKKETPGGVYTGKATLTLKDCVKTIDIRVTVWDIVLPDQLGTKNYWGMFKRNEQLAGELDTSDEMATAYFEFLLKYNINCELLPFSPKDGPEGYVELLRKYYDAPGFNTYRFYHEWRNTMYGDDYVPWDVDRMRVYLKAVARASVEDRKNYLDKALFYMLGNMDEPSTPNAYDRCVVLSRAYGKILAELDGELRAELSASENYAFYVSDVSEALLGIPCMLTLMNEIYYWQIREYEVDNLDVCLVVHGYDRESTRDAVMAEEGEHWWYTCTGPVNPYPSTHIDDYAISARLLGWMQQAYNVDGYLNWGTFITRGDYGPGAYDDNASVWNNSNGDGWIAYPGAWYGVNGPIASLRMKAVRDGMQDNALLRIFTEKYEAKGLDAAAALSIYYSGLFSGTRVLVSDSELFDSFRKEVAQTIIELDSLDILYDSIVMENSTATVRFALGDHVDGVKYNDVTLTAENRLYTVEVDLKTTDTLTLQLNIDGTHKEVTRRLCGGYSLIDDCDDVASTVLKVSSRAENAIEINEDTAFAFGNTGKSLKVTLQGEDNLLSIFRPAFRIDAADINGGKLSEVGGVTLNIYSEYDSAMTFTAYAWDGSTEQALSTVTLQPGWNVVTIRNLRQFGDGNLQFVRLTTTNFADARTFYVDEISLIKQ